MLFGNWRKILAKFSSFRVGETESQFFCRTLYAGDFSLGAQSLLKSTPGVNFITIICKAVASEDAKSAKKDSQVISGVLHFWDLQINA